MHSSEARRVRVNGLQARFLRVRGGNPRNDVSSQVSVTGSLAGGYARILTVTVQHRAYRGSFPC
jgi:hypothetical protein